MRQTQCIRSVLLAEYLLFARIKMVRKGYGKIKEIIERNCIISVSYTHLTLPTIA